MKDHDFKYCNHCLGDLKVGSRGEQVSKGYKPDLTLVDCAGSVRFVFECERGTSRKHILGGFLKAERYARENGASPTLVFVMRPKPNTTVAQIADHLRPYVAWLDGLLPGGLNLADVLVFSDEDYRLSSESGEIIGATAFRTRARTIWAKNAVANLE